MKRIRIALLSAVFLVSIAPLNAAETAKPAAPSPRARFKSLLEKLNAEPGNPDTRKELLRVAQKLKPAPAIPEEAEKHSIRGEYALKDAKTPQDFEDAAKEFQAACDLAPWVPTYYFNLGVVREKQERLADAKSNLEWYVLAAPDATDAADVKKRTVGLEYLIEKNARPKVATVDFGGRWGRDMGSIYEFLPQTDGTVSVRRTDSMDPPYIAGHAKVNGRTIEGTFDKVVRPHSTACPGPFKAVLSDDNQTMAWSGEYICNGQSFGVRQSVLVREP